MISFTVKKIKDYQTCERYYDYLYNDNRTLPITKQQMLSQRYEDTLRRVATFFFYKKQGGVVPSFSALVGRWERLWFPEETDAYDISIEQHPITNKNLVSASTSAVVALERFHRDFAKDASEIILLDERFIIPLSPTLRLEGNTDLLLRRGNEYVCIKWSGSFMRPVMSNLILDFAAQKMAIDYKNGGRKVTYSLYDIGSSSPGISVADPSFQDVETLRFWASRIEEEKVFPNRRGFSVRCRGCPFDFDCEGWKL